MCRCVQKRCSAFPSGSDGLGVAALFPHHPPPAPALRFASQLWAFRSFQGIIDDHAAIFGESFYLLKSHFPSLRRHIDGK